MRLPVSALLLSVYSVPVRPVSVDATSATVRPTGAGVSWLRAVGRMPVLGTRPYVGRIATTPELTAGTSAEIDAPLVGLVALPVLDASVSTPTVAAASPAAAAATAPAEAPLTLDRMS